MNAKRRWAMHCWTLTKGLPEPSEKNPQKFIRFIQLDCHEAENLYLTDAVLTDLGYTWDSARNAITAAAANFGQKRAALERCIHWDRRRSDIKDVIDEIAVILDPKKVPWSLRVGNVIGRARPVGDLADFLGGSVITSLWAEKKQDESAVSAAQDANRHVCVGISKSMNG
ncbi:MAG TPA: hypothetical protein VFO30_08210 [Chthoniobacterales bacterium]|nr:hypothetical protein [Chthoniobacterales bacterium]